MKTFEERIHELKNEACPDCAGIPCWQCKYHYPNLETGDDECLFESINYLYNNEED